MYPNPFNPTTTIRVDLPETSTLKVEVFNTLGRRVQLLAEGRYQAGTQTFLFDGSQLASGVYFVRAVSDNHRTQVRRMVLMK
jgi:hypothetical protein